MSRDQAKAFYAPAPGESSTRFISEQDAQGAIDVIYDDMEAAGRQVVSPLRGKSAANEKRWRDAILRARRGGKARILCIGTSNTYGWGPSDPATQNWPALLAGNLEARLGLPVVLGPEPLNKFVVDGLDPGVAHERPWISKGNWTYSTDTYYADTGAAIGEPGEGDGPSFTRDVRQAVSFMYFDRTSGRTVSWNLNGTPGSLTTTGTNQLRERVLAVSGMATLQMKNPAGGTSIIQAIGETVSQGIDVLNWGVPGIVTGKFVRDIGQWWSTVALLDGVNPDMVIFEIGANDTGGTVDPAVVKQNLTTLVSSVVAGGSAVVLCETYSANDSAYVQAIREVAQEQGVYSLSLMQIMQGNRDPWRASVADPSHMSAEGYEVWAHGITNVLLGDVQRMLF